ncbi:hypothetical protein H0194_10480 [Corynebacterium incognita]|uniref:Uncharacterized protein n=1 Tax=Corynebacterium incognita TaxID=2754725 RepID=A0A7G7CPC3_9CORY|nr:hypothetical protein [Corynebacterium incognita]QNE89439.1 hypothetical protein H0194_10480 [Corynebacterium incognita]
MAAMVEETNNSVGANEARDALAELKAVQQQRPRQSNPLLDMLVCALMGAAIGVIVYPSAWGFVPLAVAIIMIFVVPGYGVRTRTGVRASYRQDPHLGEESVTGSSFWKSLVAFLALYSVMWLPFEGLWWSVIVAFVYGIGFFVFMRYSEKKSPAPFHGA